MSGTSRGKMAIQMFQAPEIRGNIDIHSIHVGNVPRIYLPISDIFDKYWRPFTVRKGKALVLVEGKLVKSQIYCQRFRWYSLTSDNSYPTLYACLMLIPQKKQWGEATQKLFAL